MKISGILLVILGIILGVIAVTMDVSVSTGYGRVNNLGLMNDRSNLTIGAGVTFISGILLIGFSSFGSTKLKDDKKCPHCAEMIKREAKICRFCSKEQPEETSVKVSSTQLTEREFNNDEIYEEYDDHFLRNLFLSLIAICVLSLFFIFIANTTK